MSESGIMPRIWIALSGGIASGKSTVAARLRELGADVIEADVIGHDVLAPGGPAFDAVAARWPQARSGGRIDRAVLAGIVFADGDQLAELEALTHPAIADEIARRISNSSAPVVVVEVPVAGPLPEGPWTRVVVTAPRDLRLRRAEARGATPGDARRRMGAQPTDEEYADGADFVIDNSGTRAQLMAAIDDLWRDLVTG